MKTRVVSPSAITAGGFRIQPYERGVLVRNGKSSGTLHPGIHFKIPFGIDAVYLYDVRPQSIDVEYKAFSSEMMPHSVGIQLSYKADDPELLYSKGPENIDTDPHRYFSPLASQRGTEEMVKWSYRELQGRKTQVGNVIRDYVHGEVHPWGIGIDRVVVNKLEMPPKVVEMMGHNFAKQEITYAELERMSKIHELQKTLVEDSCDLYRKSMDVRLDGVRRMKESLGSGLKISHLYMILGGVKTKKQFDAQMRKLYGTEIAGEVLETLSEITGVSKKEIYRSAPRRSAMRKAKPLLLMGDLEVGRREFHPWELE